MKAEVLTKSEADISMKLDRWVNAVNKFGGANDPITRTYFARDYAIAREELSNLFEGDWVSRKVIEIPAKDATRKFIKIIHDDQNVVDKMNEEFERLEIRDKVEEAIILQRLYGGNAMVIGAYDGQEVDQPLGKVKRVDFFNNVDRFLAYPMTFYQDPELPNYGMVETYQVQNLTVVGSQIIRVHESRVIRFDGNYLPAILRVRNFGWGAPVLHSVFEALRQFGVSAQSGSAVLQDFITKKLKIANLADLLTTDQGEEALINRMQLMAQETAINNIAIYGMDEEYEKMGTPVTGLADLMDRFMEITSAAVEIPKSRFFSNMTGKLGGDAGEADLRVHYDNISAMQETRLNSRVKKIINVIAEPMGLEPGAVKFEWLPLWQLSEVDEATVRKNVADSDVAYVNAGILEPEEVALSRFGGDEIDVTGMTIDTGRREKYLKELSKQPITMGEVDDDEVNPGEPGQDPTNPGDLDEPDDDSGDVKNAGQGDNDT